MRLLYAIAIILIVGCNSRAKLAKKCNEFFPCEVTKSDTIVNFSTYHDTLIIRKDCIDEIAKMPNIQIKSIEVKGDSLIVQVETAKKEIEVVKRILDTRKLDSIQRILNAEKEKNNKLNVEIGDKQLEIDKLKSRNRTYMTITWGSIILFVLMIGLALYFGIKKKATI